MSNRISTEKDDPAQGFGAVTESFSLVDLLKTERASVSRRMTCRIKEIDLAIRQLESTEAEQIIKDAQEVLYRQ